MPDTELFDETSQPKVDKITANNDNGLNVQAALMQLEDRLNAIHRDLKRAQFITLINPEVTCASGTSVEKMQSMTINVSHVIRIGVKSPNVTQIDLSDGIIVHIAMPLDQFIQSFKKVAANTLIE